ncbi:MAG: 50S ribosomal protein L4 [Ruminococcaceae bacterium]|nr:50S ribosomal protein L4 [Oscillospiraceae bacterium]
MANIKVVDMAGKEVGALELSDKIYGIQEINGAVLHAAVRMYLLNQRQGTQSTLTRSEVSGGGKKPWRQKGTGRARQGSTRAPQWIHGGVVFAPKPREYRITMNRKVKRAALYNALSSKMAANEIIVVDSIVTESYSTKVMVNMLAAVGAGKKSLVVLDTMDDKVIKSFANIPGVKTVQADQINVYDVLNCNTFVMTSAAAAKIEEVYGK